MTLTDKFTIAYYGVMLLGVVILIYKNFTKPEEKNESDIKIMEVACKLKHDNIDKAINEINTTFVLFRQNDFKHIEQGMEEVKIGMTKIITTIEERLPKK